MGFFRPIFVAILSLSSGTPLIKQTGFSSLRWPSGRAPTPMFVGNLGLGVGFPKMGGPLVISMVLWGPVFMAQN